MAFSLQPWPLKGGRVTGEAPGQHDLLVTGHEDGSVRFWDASGPCLRPLYTLRTAPFFGTGEGPSAGHSMADEDEEEWLHFSKVGVPSASPGEEGVAERLALNARRLWDRL